METHHRNRTGSRSLAFSVISPGDIRSEVKLSVLAIVASAKNFVFEMVETKEENPS
jgi:hypothetical protein